MKLGVIADDFTGASDIALTLAEAGFRVAQFIGPQSSASDPSLDAGVVALKTRTCPAKEAVAQSLAACRWLCAQGAGQIIFKVCSTFDSTPKGNIGPVLDALAAELGVAQSLVCPAFPENGRAVYMGHLFVHDRLLNESGMQNHPLTPMTDPDLRRILAAQTRAKIGHIPVQTVQDGAGAITAALAGMTGHVILDAITDGDLLAIGAAARHSPLLCGGSGIALGLPANYGAKPAPPDWRAVRGPGVVLSGSCSRATRAQVAAYKALAPSCEIDVNAVLKAQMKPEAVAEWVRAQSLAQSLAPLVYSSADPEIVAAAQQEHGRDRAATAIETFFATLAAHLHRQGTCRFVVAGGETSGAVVAGLGINALDIGPKLAAGVPLLRTNGGMALALKSGNFGAQDFFQMALHRMEQTG